MRPLVPVATPARVLLGAASFGLFFALWAAATLGWWVPPLFLASPLRAAESGWTLLTQYGFAADIAATQSATSSGSRIRQAPKRPSCTRSEGQPTLRLTSS